ncbi:porin [Rubellimicrobium rubrum]|uniref:Porin n=1 Tax=Rubellimicrobium rubrum TaxID=2585369 RepID=A0A5C4MYT3_9RHOB|nr:porin [Rubellimicrobium rubrum]TNC49789.1 porin [Rubellimicrobium rubrum]
MKRILLASASIVAFAGAAAAEVTFGGSAELAYNLDNGDELRDGEGSDGFYWEANLGVTLSQELNNGLTAAASFTLEIVDDSDGGDSADDDGVNVDNDFVLSLTTEAGGLFFGDTAYAAETHWDPAGEMLADDFSEQDGEVVLRGDIIYSGVEAAISYNVADNENDVPEDDLDQLSFGASGTISTFTYSVAYQEESDAVALIEDDETTPDVDESEANEDVYTIDDDFEPYEVFGISVGTTFGGADVSAAYARNLTQEDSSLGLEVAYPFGPVTLGAYYVLENDDASDATDTTEDDFDNSFGVSADYASGPLSVSAFYELEDDGNDDNDDEAEGDAENAGDDDDEDSNYGIEFGYESGAGLEVYAGYIQEDGGYVGVEYDLGNGAELIASYADEDEEGAREYEAGTTVALSLEF